MNFNDQMALWASGVAEEITFWTKYIKTKGYQWPHEYTDRLNADRPAYAAMAPLLDRLGSDSKILDVGAGPLTCLGFQHNGKKLSIDACDPLAKVYSIILQINGVTPPVETKFANAENLSAFYPTNAYDISHCRNALDHSLDPLLGITEMLRVTKVGGYVLLNHIPNEAVNAAYSGLHQYNLDMQDGRFIIWNNSVRYDVEQALPIKTKITVSEGEWGTFNALIEKLEDFPDSSQQSHFRQPLATTLEYIFDLVIAQGAQQVTPEAVTQYA